MKYTIKIDSDIDAVVVEADGMINTIVAENMVMDAGVALKEPDLKRCFFDLSRTQVDPEQTMMEMVAFAQVFERAGISKSVRVAGFYIHDKEPRLYLGHGATLLGLTLKHFTDKADALRWLCQ